MGHDASFLILTYSLIQDCLKFKTFVLQEQSILQAKFVQRN